MRFVTTMVVLPISRCAREISGHSQGETNEAPESLGQVRKKTSPTAVINLPTTPAESVENDPRATVSRFVPRAAGLASIPVIDCVTSVQGEASSVDSRASPRETATPADSATVPWSDD